MDLSGQSRAGGEAAAQQAVEPRKLRALLLHRLTPAEAARLEERLILEDGLAERLQEIEYELLEAYARGRLGRRDRRAVARYLLSTEADRERLRFARALGRVADEKVPQYDGFLLRGLRWFGTPARQFGAVAVGAGIAIVAIVVLGGRLSGPGNLAPPSLPAAAPLSAPATAPIYTISLLAGLTRGAAAQPIHIPPGTAQVRLQAEVEDAAAPPYRLQVFDPQGKLLASFDQLGLQHAGRHAYVEAAVAAAALGPGRRHITLQPQSAGGAPSASWDIQTEVGN